MNALVSTFKNYAMPVAVVTLVGSAGYAGLNFFISEVNDWRDKITESSQISSDLYAKDKSLIGEMLVQHISENIVPLQPVERNVRPYFERTVQYRNPLYPKRDAEHSFETPNAKVSASLRGDTNNCKEWSIKYDPKKFGGLYFYEMQLCR